MVDVHTHHREMPFPVDAVPLPHRWGFVFVETFVGKVVTLQLKEVPIEGLNVGNRTMNRHKGVNKKAHQLQSPRINHQPNHFPGIFR
jgi:hypothetical protein